MQWLPPAALVTTFAVYSWLHILTARATVAWARRRTLLGLGRFSSLGSPWAAAEEAWLLRNQGHLGYDSSHYGTPLPDPDTLDPERGFIDDDGVHRGVSADEGAGFSDSGDLSPEGLLADESSRFLEVGGLAIHYKVAWPEPSLHRHSSFAGSRVTNSSSSSSRRGSSSSMASCCSGASSSSSTAVKDVAESSENEGAPGAEAGPGATGDTSDTEVTPVPKQCGASPADAAPASQTDGQRRVTAVAAGGEDGVNAEVTEAGVTGVTQVTDGGDEEVGIVLVHGFGGGVFSWRHIMQPLADQCGVRVITFDRPGFGE